MVDITADAETMETEDEAAVSLSFTEKTDVAKQRVKTYTVASMATGVIPFPVFDLVANTGIQLKMLHSLAVIYKIEFKKEMAKSSISSLVGSAVPIASATPVAASLSKFIPIVGQTVSYATLVVLNGAVTYALGQVFIQHFASGGTFLTFDPEAVKSYFLEQFEEGKKVAEASR